MIMISENAALEKNSISIEMILCHDCNQQKCQDIISVKTLFVIWSANMISVNVTVLQKKNTMLVIIELIFYIPFTVTGTWFHESIIKVYIQNFIKCINPTSAEK